MSIVRIPGTNGIIITDCLTSVETARKAIELYQQWHIENNGQEAEIKALFYTHCHVDHFGGAAAIVLKAKEQGQTIRIFGLRASSSMLLTLRGAPVRDTRLWSRYLDESITLFGDKTDVVFAGHHWPTWNDDEDLVLQFLSEQRDYYVYLHNESLRQINDRQTPLEIADNIQMPPNLSSKTHLQGYGGSISHNVKGVYDKYMDSDIAKQAMAALASVYNTLGWGSENATWRNFYLTVAHELQFGPQKVDFTMSLEALLTFSFDELFDTIAIKTEGPAAFKKPEVLSNAAMTGHAIPYVASSEKPNPGSDLTIWLDHVNLARLVGETALGRSPVIVGNPYIALTTAGDVDAWTKITALIKLPTADFNIVTP
ncbi:hypothetical protein BCON_0300g00020 [Botryotinia convoluta]|uniref:Metallo-beta-lactamase domain-containing protein n=1 Tax=Botryotinia convoluta TaxID=54673 RepID=A0A4Z1HI86_9HELO|nr:hypothetical protein BCON_0300g00020 [Botryotinia convoluta]